MSVQKASESRAARLAALDDARSPRVGNSSTNHSSRGSRAGHLGVGETRSRFSEREEGGGTQVRFVTLERSRWRVVLRLSVPAGTDGETAEPRSIARTRAGNARPQTRRGRLALVVRGGAFGAVARRASRVPGTAVALFSRTRCLLAASRSGVRSRALRGARSRPGRFVSASSCV